jgi:acetoin utilization deacetylase AcuC-like enzyme
MGPGHPECPARLEVITQALKRAAFKDKLVWREAPLASKAQLMQVHDTDYIEKIFSLSPHKGYVPLDPDTLMNPFTLNAALRASGAMVQAVDDVFQGDIKRAFCLVRPPGHHAEPDKAMGFCFFNNIAVGVMHALNQYHCEKIAIVDFDVHHGNGTQAMFLEESRVLFWSSFQHPFYPGTALEPKRPNIHLCPLPAGTNSAQFQQKIKTDLLPLLENFKPQCIFVSAGFDAHQLDPLADFMLINEDYQYISRELVKISQQYAQGRIISTLEGGYQLQALPEAVISYLEPQC